MLIQSYCHPNLSHPIIQVRSPNKIALFKRMCLKTIQADDSDYQIELQCHQKSMAPINSKRLWTRFDFQHGRLLTRGGYFNLISGQKKTTILHPRLEHHDAYWVADTLAEMALIHAFSQYGLLGLHAAALQYQQQGLIIAATAYQGKSSFCAALLAAGGQIISDDFILLEKGDQGIQAHALRSDLFLRQGSRDILPDQLKNKLQAWHSNIEARWSLLRADAPDYFLEQMRPQYLIFLHKDRRLKSFRLQPISINQAFIQLLQQTTPVYLSRKFPQEYQQLMPTVLALLQQVRCYQLRLGKALIQKPAITVQDILAQLI